MLALSDIKFSAWRDSERTMCSFCAKVPGSKLGYISFYFTADEFRDFVSCKRDSFVDIGYISFYFTADEFRDFVSCKRDSFVDIAHNLHCFIDTCTFYDLNFPAESHGVATVPFIRATIPLFVRKILLRWAEKRWSEESHERRPEIEISSERAARWEKLYGFGKGKVELVTDDTSRAYMEERLSENEGKNNLREMIDRVLTIARNGTSRFWHVGKVRLYKDWDGFAGEVLGPKGNPTLFFGLVNHNPDGKPEWSIHT